MSFRTAARRLTLAALLCLSSQASRSQSIDPAVVGERLQRLNATVESLELTAASQKRQIDGLSNDLQKVREETNRELNARAGQRPWADDIKRHNDDLKRLADAIAEVDRKRAADHEQVLKILGELRKSITALAEAPPVPAPNRNPPKGASEPRTGSGASRPRAERTERLEPGGDGEATTPPPAKETINVKAFPYTVGKGETLSAILDSFNADAKKKGFQPLSVQQVMKFNKITNANRVREGMVLNLPLYPKQEKP